VAVTGADGGREVIALLDRGFDTVGFEPNDVLVVAGSTLMRKLGYADRLRVCARDAFLRTRHRATRSFWVGAPTC
jgi:hypothetical protein